MSQWVIKPSYKYDLANFCNLFTQDEYIIQEHTEEYEHFKTIISARPDLVGLAKQMFSSGFNPGLLLLSIFDLIEYDGYDIDQICLVLDDPNLLMKAREYYVEETKLLTEEMFKSMETVIPLFSEMTKYVHNSGFLSYWKENCLPEIQQKCEEYKAQTSKYFIVDEVNEMLGKGYELSMNEVTLYLCKFASPFGSSLRNQSFASDISWDLHVTVATALHEMIHPPFAREKIQDIAEVVWNDEFMLRAFRSQRHYNSPLRFMEENIVEAAHVYLAEKMGVIDNPLEYFIKHDGGSHVASVVIYDQLRKGVRDNVDSLEEAVFKMLDNGSLMPGMLWENYNNVYREADMEKEHPFQEK